MTVTAAWSGTEYASRQDAKEKPVIQPVIQTIRRLNVTATESLVGLALGVSAVMMGLLLWAIVWQSNVIAYQRDIIKWMWSSKFGG